MKIMHLKDTKNNVIVTANQSLEINFVIVCPIDKH